MIATKLVTKDDVRQFKDLSRSISDDLFNNLLLQTQIEDIGTLLGEKLFNDILSNPTAYNDLLVGGSYILNGITYSNYGLKAVISYYLYARHIMFGNVKDTPFGAMVKVSGEGSAEPSQKMKDALYQANRQTAFTIWQSVENYLIRTKNVLFLQNKCQRNTHNTFKIGIVK